MLLEEMGHRFVFVIFNGSQKFKNSISGSNLWTEALNFGSTDGQPGHGFMDSWLKTG